jgi:hypothetical protein
MLFMWSLLLLGGTHLYAWHKYDEKSREKDSELRSKGYEVEEKDRQLKAKQLVEDSFRNRR